MKIIAGEQKLGKIVQCKMHIENNIQRKLRHNFDAKIVQHHNTPQTDSESSSCNSGEILMDSDEDEWFEPNFSQEM